MTKEGDMKEGDQVIEVVDVTESAASPEPGPYVVEVMKRVHKK